MNRRQIMIAASSIGPGSTNMVTAAATALANRLPVLFLGGDTFASRLPDPVLQQVEHFGNPTTTVNDAFKAVTRYWDRIARPEQILSSLPQAVAIMLDPADCGPAFIGLAQDVQGEAYDYPAAFFEPVVHRIPRPRPDADQVREAATLIRKAKKPLIIAGGGVHYSGAEVALAAFAARHNLPVSETTRGKTILLHDNPLNVGGVGVTGSSSGNALAADADVVIAVGTRLQDFVTGSWTAFSPDMRLVAINTARFDAVKHRALPVVGDALVGLEELSEALAGWRAPDAWTRKAAKEYAGWNALIDKLSGPTNAEVPSYAQVIGAINRICDPTDLALTAAGGLPGEILKNWRAKAVDTFDCEYGYSCMGYEIAGAWGAKMALPDRDVIALVGDGSYLMMNSDIYSSVLSGHKLIVILCDNGGFAVIDRLQNFKGSKSFNNLIADSRIKEMVTSISPGTPSRWGPSPRPSTRSANWRAPSSAPSAPTAPRSSSSRSRSTSGRRAIPRGRPACRRSVPANRSAPPAPTTTRARPASGPECEMSMTIANATDRHTPPPLRGKRKRRAADGRTDPPRRRTDRLVQQRPAAARRGDQP